MFFLKFQITTPESTTNIEDSIFVIENAEEEPQITTELPRQNKNIKNLLQPDFSVDVVEEPAAEPVSTIGEGWVPLNFEQVLGE